MSSGATPLSLVFQILAAPVRVCCALCVCVQLWGQGYLFLRFQCDTPRGPEDWERYAAVAALVPATGWNPEPTRAALIGIIVRAIDSKVRGFVKKASATRTRLWDAVYMSRRSAALTPRRRSSSRTKSQSDSSAGAPAAAGTPPAAATAGLGAKRGSRRALAGDG